MTGRNSTVADHPCFRIDRGQLRRAGGKDAGPSSSAADEHSSVNDILCHREQRYVGAQLTFHYDRKQIILEQTEVAKGLEGQYAELFDYWDKPLEVRWREHLLPYRVFSKDQRVSHSHRREQAAWPRARRREGAAGPPAGYQGYEQQREDRLQEASATGQRLAAYD